jgi:hypothetical protein
MTAFRVPQIQAPFKVTDAFNNLTSCPLCSFYNPPDPLAHQAGPDLIPVKHDDPEVPYEGDRPK